MVKIMMESMMKMAVGTSNKSLFHTTFIYLKEAKLVYIKEKFDNPINLILAVISNTKNIIFKTFCI